MKTLSHDYRESEFVEVTLESTGCIVLTFKLAGEFTRHTSVKFLDPRPGGKHEGQGDVNDLVNALESHLFFTIKNVITRNLITHFYIGLRMAQHPPIEINCSSFEETLTVLPSGSLVDNEYNLSHRETDAPDEFLLTQPHQCQQCKKPLRIHGTNDHRIAGRIRSTHKCGYCEKVTSVYATLHLCSGCNCVLESPRGSSGKDYNCPNCEYVGQVPHDFLESIDSVHVESGGEFFSIQCPNCSEAWAARITDSGNFTVCPDCRVSFIVPCYGEHLEFERSIFATPKKRCGDCRHPIPLSAKRCPICGTF